MDRFDFSPLFRSTIGFDRVTRLLDAATRVDSASLGYPPYNIEKTGEDGYRLTMAVAGFYPSEIVHENTLAGDGQGAEGRRRTETVTCTAASRAARLSAASAWPTTSRWRAPAWTMACCTSTWCARFPKR